MLHTYVQNQEEIAKGDSRSQLMLISQTIKRKLMQFYF